MPPAASTRSYAAMWQDRQPAMGGTAAVTVVGGPRDLLDECFRVLRELEAAWSRFTEGSDVWRLNWAQGRPVRVRACTVRLVRELIRAWSTTQGDFDPTVLPRLAAVGYDASWVDQSRRTRLPDSARWPGDIPGIEVDGVVVRLPRGTTLDAGGLGKGLAADIITEFALAHGARGALVEVGGDLVVGGEAPDGAAWTVGIEDPFAPGTVLTTVRLVSGAVATSSRRRRSWNTTDGTAHHLIAPATGLSAVSATVASTVIAGSGTRAEALAKLAFVREPEPLLVSLPALGASGLVVTADHRCRYSPNWKAFE